MAQLFTVFIDDQMLAFPAFDRLFEDPTSHGFTDVSEGNTAGVHVIGSAAAFESMFKDLEEDDPDLANELREALHPTP